MNILAIDTSLTAVSACIYDCEAAELVVSETIIMKRGHAEALLPLIDRVVHVVPGGFSSLGRVAVTVGPGSFTGVRVGIAAARAIGVSTGVPVVGVSTLAAFASQLVLDGGDSNIVAAIDAHHDQIYVQVYSATGRTILRPQISSPRAVAGILGKGPIRVTGSAGPIMVLEAWAQFVTADIGGELINPAIEYVAKVGVAANPGHAPPIPLYLKAADVTTAAFSFASR